MEDNINFEYIDLIEEIEKSESNDEDEILYYLFHKQYKNLFLYLYFINII